MTVSLLLLGIVFIILFLPLLLGLVIFFTGNVVLLLEVLWHIIKLAWIVFNITIGKVLSYIKKFK